LRSEPRADLRILILNWRCPTNPQAGGAEFVTFEIARRLVELGNSVEWFSATFPGAPSEEALEGVRIVRGGRQWTVHWSAFRHYRGKTSGRFDVVIDEVNTIPFFTPLWADIPVVMLIHQLAREVWWYEARFPLNTIGFLAEPLYLRCYRHIPVLTVSASTQDDLRRLGFKAPITIVPEGLEAIEYSHVVKSTEACFLYVGRLAPSKRIGHMLRALAQFRKATGTGTLWLVGSGSKEYESALLRLAQRLNVKDHVRFLGRVSSLEKHRLMAEADALLMTSVREGWGLVVTEANACGTPAIVYDVPGLRDSVRNESTGLVVPPHPDRLCAAMIRLVADPVLYARLATEGRRWSSTFSFDAAAQVVAQTLQRRSLPGGAQVHA
jgi:glycosyltransferase involved in cell wall biosynthesis